MEPVRMCLPRTLLLPLAVEEGCRARRRQRGRFGALMVELWDLRLTRCVLSLSISLSRGDTNLSTAPSRRHRPRRLSRTTYPFLSLARSQRLDFDHHQQRSSDYR